MSLHLNQQCQRADAHSPPVRLFRASVMPTRECAKRTRDLVTRPRPLAGGAYMCGFRMRQPAFCNCVAVCRLTRSDCRSAALAYVLNRISTLGVKCQVA